MSKQNKRHLVPELRFPEFCEIEAWACVDANELFQQVTDKNHKSDLPILAITQEYGAIPRELINYNVAVSEKSLQSYKVVDVGDFIISLRSFQGGIEYSTYKGICSPAYVILRRKGEVNEKFFKQYFKTNSFILNLTKNIEGLRDGKMISYKQFSDVPLPLPNQEEQKRIAEFLFSVDEFISAGDQKLKVLKDHKKGLMQRLFPCEVETVPDLRFPEFKNEPEWSAGELKDACLMRAGNFVRAANILKQNEEDSFPCFGGNGLRGYTKTFTHEGKYSLIGRQGALCGNVTLVKNRFHATEHAIVVTPKQGIVTDWLYHKLVYLNLNQFATGQAQPGLSVDNLNGVTICVPESEDEQQRIADCLSSIDKLIALQGVKIETLKFYKKGLMQHLFPSVDEVGI